MEGMSASWMICTTEKSEDSNCSDINAFKAGIDSLVTHGFTTSAFCEQIREQLRHDMQMKQKTLISTLTILKTKIHRLYQDTRRTTTQIINHQPEPCHSERERHEKQLPPHIFLQSLTMND